MEEGRWRPEDGGCRLALVLLVSTLLAAAAVAQAPDSALVPLPDAAATGLGDGIATDGIEADSVATPPPAALPLAPEGPAPGRPVSPIPALTPALDPTDLLGRASGAFVYDLGIVGAAHGLSLDGRAPEAHALTLDGRPLTDLFTGRPRTDLLPLDLLDRLRLAPTRYGRPGAVVATTRPFRAAVPVTELRYLPGQEGIQFVSVAHAQTRRLPGIIRDAGDRGRLSVLAHVSGRQATGPFAGEELGGFHALARVAVGRPGLSVTLTEYHVQRTVGARDGLAPPVDASFGAVFDPFQAVVLTPEAERQTKRNDLALTVRFPLGTEALTAEAWWTRQHERYTPGGLDTLLAKGNRYGGRLALPFRAGPHGLLLRLDGFYDGTPWSARNPYPDAPARTRLSAMLRDTVRVGGWFVEGEGGAAALDGGVWPVASLRIGRGGVYVAAARAAEVPERLTRVGFLDLDGERDIQGLDDATEDVAKGVSAVTSAEAGVGLRLGAVGVRVRAYAHQTDQPFALWTGPDGRVPVAFTRADDPFRRAGADLTLLYRTDAARGLYARVEVRTSRFLNPDASPLHARAAEALPDLWGSARVGLRARDLFDGALDLDLAVKGRAWTAFRGRLYLPPTATFALSNTSFEDTPARGVLDLVAEAQLQERATLFLVYENVLATRLYSGAYLVPVFPLPAHRLRAGLFWTLFD